MLNSSTSGSVATSPVLGTDKEQQRKMNVVRAVKDYILDMVDSVKGVKVLLLDEYTVSMTMK